LAPEKQKTSFFSAKPGSFYHVRTETCHEENLNNEKASLFKRERKFSV